MTAAAPVLIALAVILAGRKRTDLPEFARPVGPARRRGQVRRARTAAAGLGVAVALVVGGVTGIATGTAAFVLTAWIVSRLEPAQVRRRREDRAAELPLTLDLLSVCLQAGMPLVAALETVASALPGPFSDDLRVVAGLQRLGAAPPAAWDGLATDQDLAPVARAVSRSAESGSRLAAAFDRLGIVPIVFSLAAEVLP